MIKSFFVRWLIIFVSVLLASKLLPDYIGYASPAGVAIFAAILGLLNVFVKPLLSILTFPLSCLTMGLFVLVINTFLFWLAGQLSGGSVYAAGVVGAFLGALVVSVVSIVAARLT